VNGRKWKGNKKSAARRSRSSRLLLTSNSLAALSLTLGDTLNLPASPELLPHPPSRFNRPILLPPRFSSASPHHPTTASQDRPEYVPLTCWTSENPAHHSPSSAAFSVPFSPSLRRCQLPNPVSSSENPKPPLPSPAPPPPLPPPPVPLPPLLEQERNKLHHRRMRPLRSMGTRGWRSTRVRGMCVRCARTIGT
jgi:hypothetical protein